MHPAAKLAPALLALTLALASSAPALAQPVDLPIPPATTDKFPPGVKVAKAASGAVYADKQGHVLYGMDMRTLLRWSPDPAQYCAGACAQEWEPLLAPPGAAINIAFPKGFGDRRSTPPPAGLITPQAAPDWTIIAGPQGPQWVYKGWHMVFTRKGAKRLSTAFDGAENMIWNTLKYVPPVPVLTAPPGIGSLFSAGAYVLTDKEGRVLFTGTCGNACAGWKPLAGPLASAGIGAWTVSTSGDQPQWLYHGKPVFISQEDDPATAPAGATVLHP